MVKRILTLRRAIILVVVFGLLVPAALISSYSFVTRYNFELKQQTRELLQQNANILSNSMQQPLWNINRESALALLEAMMTNNNDIVRIAVWDNTQELFAVEEHRERRIGYTASTRAQVTYRGAIIGSIEIEVGSTRLRKLMIAGWIESMIALITQVILSIVMILILLEKRLVGPLERLGKGAQRLAERQLDVPFTWKRLDEIGLLSQRLEDTRISLRRLFEELDHKNRELEQDIDKRKQIEQELYEREARFRVLVEQSPIAIIEWDKKNCVIEWNAAAEKIFGYSREQALGQHADFIVSDEKHRLTEQARLKLTVSNDDIHRINQNRRADGVIIICQWSTTDIDDESGHTGRLLSMAEDITEKCRTEEAQSLSELKFASAFQCNPDSVSITRLSDDTFLDINGTFEKITGFTHVELINKSALELNMWVNPDERNSLLKQLDENTMVRDFPWSMRTKYGSLRQCLINSTIFNVEQELYMLAVIRDVTDQRILEAQKAEADRVLLRLAQGTQEMAGESFFELLVDDLASALRTDHVFIGRRIVNAPNRIRTISAHLRGHIIENFEYNVIADSPCADTLAGDICVFTTGLRTTSPNPHIIENQWDSYAGAPIRDIEGNTIGLLVVLHSKPLGNPDLVRSLLQVFSERASAELERKRTEEALRTSEQRFSTIFQSSPVAMVVLHFWKSYAIKDINSAFEQLFLRDRASVIGKDAVELSMFCNNDDRKLFFEEFGESRNQHQHEIWMYRGDRSKILVQFSGQAFSLSGEKFMILACEDVTEKRHIESTIRELNATLEERVIERTEELQQANQELAYTLNTLNMAQEELVRSEKLAALGSLVAGISHELNTPIGNSLMVASTLVEHTRDFNRRYANGGGLKRSMLEAYLEDSTKAGDILIRNLYRAANLVTSFKQVAVDQTSSQRRTFSLAEMISEIMLTLWPTLKKTAFIVDQRIPDTISLDSYPGPLGQVITNLVNNALLHGFENRTTGTVSISAQSCSDEWIELTVKDDGVGIPPGNLNRIFDPFFTTKLGAGGSGLGLNITHNIVTGILGGRIRVQSDIGIGTTFIVTLPLISP
jgi:PAS domain S-box-containing protein